MKRVLFITILVAGGLALHSQDNIFRSEMLTPVWNTEKVFDIPESVCYDEARDVLYVSSIKGKPTDEDRNGFISVLTTDGEIKELKWVTGLDAPKGMGVLGDKLYVSDINELAEIDINTGEVVKRYPAPEALFLNDIAIDKDGNVYVSDMSATTIYRLSGGEFKVWMDDEVLTGPNGLYTEGGYLYVGCMKILKVSLEDGSYETVADETGGIDGLEATGKNSFLFSDWTGNVYHVELGSDPLKLLDTTKAGMNAADIEYIPSKNLLLVPTFLDNRVFAYKLNQ